MTTKKVKQGRSLLAKYTVRYEETERKPIKVAKKKTSKKSSKKGGLKQFVAGKFSAFRENFHNTINKLKHPRKKAKKTTKAERDLAKKHRNNAILGVGLLLVVVSIAYSTSVIYIGVDSSASRIALLPQVVFAALTMIKAFSKLYK